MHIYRNDDRKIRQFSVEIRCVSIKRVQQGTALTKWNSESSFDGTLIILIETFR